MTHTPDRARTTVRTATRTAARRTLAVLACLTATTMLAGCGDDGGDSGADSGADGGAADAAAAASGSPTTEPTTRATPGTASPTTGADPTSPGTDNAPSSASTAPSTPAPPAPTRTSEPESPQLIPYAGGESPGVQVRSAADAEKLDGAPEAFKEFIGRTAEQVVAKSHCVDGFVGLTVEAVRTDGYAIGGVNDCGGYLALWAVVDGRWTEVGGTQEEWDCAVLRRAAAPSELVGEKCYDYDAEQERDYHQA